MQKEICIVFPNISGFCKETFDMPSASALFILVLIVALIVIESQSAVVKQMEPETAASQK